MTNFVFLTSGPIEYILPGLSLYESLIKTSMGLEFPGLRKDCQKEVEEHIGQLDVIGKKFKIFSATSKQAQETALIVGRLLKGKTKVDRKLDAISFDFRKIMDQKEFEILGSQGFDTARPRFLEAFFKNQLSESKQAAKKRADSFLKDNLASSLPILAISHSFFLMILRAYFLGGERVFENYSYLREICQPEKRSFGFLEGFKVEINYQLKINSLVMLK